MKYVLLINTNKEIPARRLLARADIALAVVTTPRYRHFYPDGTRLEVVDDIENVAEVKLAALRLLSDVPFSHVVAPSEFNLQPAAFVRSYYGLAGPGYDMVNAFTNKYVMKQRLRDHGIPVAPFTRVARLSEAGDAAAELGWPIVVKPVVGGGAEDVLVIHDDADLARHCAAGRSERMLAFGHFLVAERFLTIDEEFHCDGILSEGEIRLSAVSRYFAPVLGSVGHVVGSYTLPESDPRTAIVRDLHRSVVRAMGLRDGVTHLEAFRVGDRFIVGEVAIRPGGGGIPQQLSEQYGVDIWDALIATSLNEPVATVSRQPDDYLAQYMLPLRRGRITRISSADELRDIPGVVHAEVRHRVGDQVTRALNSVAMAGLVLVRARTETEIHAAVQALHERYELQTVEVDTDEG
ncbi:hypothetical protein [Krasilnikovia sp. MM14-A1004]|uniref:ATP-grasp domain-containing protein n=1 Tax=Krasilnikovia sp. MM14-A1004 TaxID=3373541 RepID=UPI00399C76EF